MKLDDRIESAHCDRATTRVAPTIHLAVGAGALPALLKWSLFIRCESLRQMIIRRREISTVRLLRLLVGPAQFGQQVRHLDRGNAGLEPFVARLGTGALDSLLDRIGRQHAKDHRYIGAE